jgi:oxygen-independent coproporphyrinogen-3 oxidase
MAPDIVADILSEVRRGWAVGTETEITIEANPGSVEAGRFRDYAAAGVNRLSLGIQALRDPDLRRLGRWHNAEEARLAFGIARAVFPRVSFDLIYARQDQTLADWTAELREAVAMAADHLSVYQLTIEPGTPFHTRNQSGQLTGLPNDDLAADLYAATQDILGEAGFPAYEVSNHARRGAECLHNLVYWRSGDFAGIGPGAHGRLTLGGVRHATESLRPPRAWLEAVARRGSGESLRAALPAEEQAEEHLLMGLRLAEGIDLDRAARFTGRGLDDARIDDLAVLGLLERRGRRIAATPRGMAVLNAVLRELVAD